MRLLLSVLVAGLVATTFAQSPTSTVGVVTGVVVNPAGTPVPGAAVELRRGPSRVAATTADRTGQFRFEKVAAGTYQVRASAPGLAAASVAITVDDRALTRLRRDKLGFVFQFFNLLPVLTAEENLVLPLSIAGRKPDQEWLQRLVDTVGLRIAAATGPPSSPGASSSGSPSPGRSSPNRPSSSPTSRPATSTRSPAATSCGSCARRSTSSARR